MNAATLPCPTCSCTGTDTHEDRHTGTNMDTCRTCGGEGFIPAHTGETAEASYRPAYATDEGGNRDGAPVGILHEEVRALVATARRIVADRDARIATLEAKLATIQSAPTASAAGPVGTIIEAADTPGSIGPGDLALTIQWPDGAETVEHVSENAARALGYRYPDEDATPTPAPHPVPAMEGRLEP